MTTIEADSKPVQNVVLVIGDGMGPQQVCLLLSYAGQLEMIGLDRHGNARD
ncbi:MAG: hypothetical protein ACU83N_17220 [Gammaproteobacteria bacterium]